MYLVIVAAFLASIIYVIVINIIKYGFSNDTIKLILNQILSLRGFYFLLVFIGVCVMAMTQIEDESKWLIIPFILCGIGALLYMYEKTKKYGKYLFIIFFGAVFLAFPTIAIINEYRQGGTINFASIIFLAIIYVAAIVAIINILKK